MNDLRVGIEGEWRMRGGKRERESEPNPFSLTNGRQQRQFSSSSPQDTTINRHTHFISVSEGGKEGGGGRRWGDLGAGHRKNISSTPFSS